MRSVMTWHCACTAQDNECDCERLTNILLFEKKIKNKSKKNFAVIGGFKMDRKQFEINSRKKKTELFPICF